MRALGGGLGGFWAPRSRTSPSTMVSDRRCYEHGNEEKDRLKEATKDKKVSLERSLVSRPN